MADGVSVGLFGEKEVVKALEAKLKAVQDGLEGAVLAGAEPIRDAAEVKAPRFTGELSENIFIETIEVEDGLVIVAVGPDDEIFWAMFVEFGTNSHNVKRLKAQGLQIGPDTFRVSASGVSSPPQPFLRPAFDSEQDNAIEAIAEEIKDLLDL